MFAFCPSPNINPSLLSLPANKNSSNPRHTVVNIPIHCTNNLQLISNVGMSSPWVIAPGLESRHVARFLLTMVFGSSHADIKLSSESMAIGLRAIGVTVLLGVNAVEKLAAAAFFVDYMSEIRANECDDEPTTQSDIDEFLCDATSEEE
eukprot:gene36069-44482_t